MFSFVELTDGTIANACELTNNQTYALVSYAPVVPPLKDALIEGRCPWEDVQESITFHALGQTAAEAYAAAAAVTELLDNARRWERGQTVTPYRLRVKAQDSTLAILEAPIYGRPRGGPPNLALPAVWSEQFGRYAVQNITITFVRGGPFLSAASETQTGGATANPGIMALTMPSSKDIPGPCVVSLAGFTTSAGSQIDIPDGLLLAAPATAAGGDSGIAAFFGRDRSGLSIPAGASFNAAQADAAARPAGVTVFRLDHLGAALNAESRLSYTLTSWGNSRRMAVYLTVRNNSASTWVLRAAASTYDETLETPPTPTYTLTGPTNPQVLYLGELDLPDGATGLNLYFAVTVISGTCTIDIDTIRLVDLTNGRAVILQITGKRITLAGGFPSDPISTRVETQPLALPNPRARRVASNATLPTSYSGSPSTWIAGQVIKLCWYATHLFGGTTPYWTTQNAAGAAILSLTPTVTRQSAYLVPE